jgi:type IV pilus assembly protein PilN
MIRVNLVEGGRQVEKQRTTGGFEISQNVSLIGTVLLLLAAAFVGWRYWSITQQGAALDTEIAAATREEAQLKDLLTQVQTFEARRQQLQQRVALIDELRKGQAAPVHMIDQISRALPDDMWLTKLQQKEFEVTIEGECLSLTALSDFVGNLEGSRYFVKPVEILDSAVVAARENLPEVIHFSVRGTFRMAGIEPKPVATPNGPGGKLG